MKSVPTSTEPTYALQLVKPFWSILGRYPELSALVEQDAGEPPADTRVPVSDAQRFLQYVVDRTGEQDLGLLAAQETRIGAFDVLEFVAFSAPTRRAAADTMLRYIRLVNQAADFRIEVIEGRAHVMLNSTVPLTRAGIDFQSGALFMTAIRWFGEQPDNLEVWLTYPRPDDTSQHVATFGGAMLRFDAPWDGFVFDADQLNREIVSADPAGHRVLREHLEGLLAKLSPGDGVVEQVRARLLSSLQDGAPTAEACAEGMGVTRRTLTRRLAAHGTTYTKLLADVRLQAAQQYLSRTDHTVDDIAFLLGFSESSAFTRAFQRWQGTPPAAYRRQQRQG